MTSEIQDALRKRYPDLHPLIFKRSVEKAQTDGELFDILETVPDEYPIVWCEESRRWEHSDDLLQNRDFVNRASRS